MNKKNLIVIILFILFLSGCTMNEIEEYSIVAGIGIDYKDSNYEVTYEIYKENNGQTTTLNSIIKSDIGLSISEAVNNITNKMYQTPYLNHCLLIVLGEGLINNKLDETLNYLIHDVRIRSSCYVVSTNKKSAKELLNESQNIKQVVSYNLYKKLDQTPRQVGIWNNSNFDYIMNEKIDDNGTIIIPIANYKEDFDLSSAYVIKNNNNTVYKVNSSELFIIQLFHNIVDEGVIKINNQFVYLKNAETKIKQNNNKYTLDIYLQILSYDDLGIDLNDDTQRKEKIKLFEEDLDNKVYEIFKEYQDKNVDTFGIYKYIQRYNHSLYKKIKKDYDNYFSNILIESNIRIDLLTSGLSEERINYDCNNRNNIILV